MFTRPEPQSPRRGAAVPRAGGMTLVEMLVVIVIIALLMALLLPAVQGVREAARRIHCRNNLKQIGIALSGHVAYHNAFPHSVAYDNPNDVNPGPPDRNGRGWILGILPYLEQQPLFDRFTAGDCFAGSFPSGGLWKPGCRELMRLQTATLHCPSDSGVVALSTNAGQWVGIPVAQTSYKGVIGDTRMGGAHTGSPECHTRTKCPGMFWRHTWFSPISPASIRDGLSNTFAVGEDVVAANLQSVAYYANGDYSSCHAPLNYFPRPPTPNQWAFVMSFRSLHPGGAHFCFADGSVHYVSESIELAVYQGLATRAGREPVSLSP